MPNEKVSISTTKIPQEILDKIVIHPRLSREGNIRFIRIQIEVYTILAAIRGECAEQLKDDSES